MLLIINKMPYSHLLPYKYSKQMYTRRRLTSIQDLSPQLYKSIRLCFYTLIIFIAQIMSGILSEKIYKTPYQNNENPNVQDYFSDPFGIPLFSTFAGMFYGFIKYQIASRNDNISEQQQEVPTKFYFRISCMDASIHVFCNWAIILASFTIFNLIHCCSLLSVVLVAVFCSKYMNLILGQDDNQYLEEQARTRVKPKQIIIALIVVVGVIVFNAFMKNSEQSSSKPLTIWSTSLIICILAMQGIRPELVMHVRRKYHPKPSLLYYQVAKYSFFVILIISVLSTQFFKTMAFIWNHDQISVNLLSYATLTVIGDIFVYRILVLHKQHVIPFLMTIKRVLVSIVNILWFHHQINSMQMLGLGIVGFGVFSQLLNSYLEMQTKDEKQTPAITKFQQLEEEIEEDTI